MDTTRGNGSTGGADPLDVALNAISQFDVLINDLLAQEELKDGDKLEIYMLERRAIDRVAYAQAYQAAVTNRLLGHLVHAVNNMTRSDCVWKKQPHYDYWTAECGMEWSLDEGDPADNGMRFCPNCGGSLVVGEEEAGG